MEVLATLTEDELEGLDVIRDEEKLNAMKKVGLIFTKDGRLNQKSRQAAEKMYEKYLEQKTMRKLPKESKPTKKKKKIEESEEEESEEEEPITRKIKSNAKVYRVDLNDGLDEFALKYRQLCKGIEALNSRFKEIEKLAPKKSTKKPTKKLTKSNKKVVTPPESSSSEEEVIEEEEEEEEEVEMKKPSRLKSETKKSMINHTLKIPPSLKHSEDKVENDNEKEKTKPDNTERSRVTVL